MSTTKEPKVILRLESPADVHDLEIFMATIEELAIANTDPVEISFEGISITSALTDFDRS